MRPTSPNNPAHNPTTKPDCTFGNHSAVSGNPGPAKGAITHRGRAGDGRTNYAGQMAMSQAALSTAHALNRQIYDRSIQMDGRGRQPKGKAK